MGGVRTVDAKRFSCERLQIATFIFLFWDEIVRVMCQEACFRRQMHLSVQSWMSACSYVAWQGRVLFCLRLGLSQLIRLLSHYFFLNDSVSFWILKKMRIVDEKEKAEAYRSEITGRAHRDVTSKFSWLSYNIFLDQL